jgi:hypothetical protein
MHARPLSHDPSQDPAVVHLRDLAVEETILAYLELVDSEPEKADVAALALREQGRQGRLGAEHLPALISCLDAAPNALVLGHLAKALATFGRRAGSATEALVEKMRDLVITDDVEYWSFDGCVWALGYLGGDAAASFIEELGAERPNRAVRSSSIYRGVMPKAAREKAFQAALDGAGALLKKADPGQWRTQKLKVQRSATAKSSGKAWDLRVASR